MACGRLDVEVGNRAWWLARVFGKILSPADIEDMHPLRRLEKLPPTPDQQKASEATGWMILGKGLAHLNTQRKG